MGRRRCCDAAAWDRGVAMALLDRLRRVEEPFISVHQFYAGLVAFRDGVITRSQLETFFGLASTGPDMAQLDTIINGYASAVDKHRYLEAVHAMFMLLPVVPGGLSTAEITAWLTTAEGAL